MLTVAVLGPVVVRRDGAEVRVPAGKTTELLVRLALDAGRLVRTTRLIEDLWPQRAATVAPNTLQAKVSKLRRALGDPRLVGGSPTGYVLTVDPRDVDALEVLRLREEVGALRTAGAAEQVVRRGQAALAMFTDDLLPDAGDGNWLAPQRFRLEEARLSLIDEILAARSELGESAALVSELEALVVRYPFREQLWQLLITALYRTGRQADALDAYGRIREMLDAELGLEPGGDLQALQQRILRQDPSLDPPHRRPQRAPSAVDDRGPRSGDLIGRADELQRLGRLVADHRLVTVAGPAGVGKTRLVTELVAEDNLGEVGVVRLEAARTTSAVWQSLGDALGVDAATEAMVLDRLRGRVLLLVLDNCEQVRDALVDPIGRILDASTTVRVLTTSQRSLGIDGEVVYPLGPLGVDSAVQLFRHRAERFGPSALSASAPDELEALCGALDGLPLAIELAAARVRILPVAEITRRLDDRFALLNDPNSPLPPRRRALGAALAWSYDLLFPDDQRGLWALGTFSGGAPLGALEAVMVAIGVPGTATVDVIDRLADRSLIVADVGSRIGGPGEVRYRMLDSVRAFSRDRRDEAGSAEPAHAAHASWISALAARADRGVRGPEQRTYLDQVRTERANIDAALEWCRGHDPATGLRIADGLGWAWIVLGAGVPGARRIRSAVEAAQLDPEAEASPVNRGVGLLLAGWLEASGGSVDLAAADIEAGVSAAPGELADLGRLHLGFVETVRGRPREALALLTTCRETFARVGLGWEQAAAWVMSAWAEVALGEAARGRAASERALELVLPLGDEWGLGHAEAILGALAQAEHRFADAVAHLGRAADAASNLGFAAAAAHHRANLGRAHHQWGRLDEAATTYRRAITEAEAAGDLRTAALARVRLGRVLRDRDEHQAARADVESAAAWYAAAGGGDDAALADFLLAALSVDDSGRDTALLRVLEVARREDQTEIELLALDRLAALRADQGEPADAEALLVEADRLLPAVQHLLGPQDRVDGDRARRLIGAVRTGARGG